MRGDRNERERRVHATGEERVPGNPAGNEKIRPEALHPPASKAGGHADPDLLGSEPLAAAANGIDSTSGLALQAFGRTTATLMNLCLLLAPLVAVVMGAAVIAGEGGRCTRARLATAGAGPVPVRLRLPAGDQASLEQLLTLRVRAGDGRLVPLSELVTVQRLPWEPVIHHKDLMPVVYVTGDEAGDLDSPLYGMFDLVGQVSDEPLAGTPRGLQRALRGARQRARSRAAAAAEVGRKLRQQSQSDKEELGMKGRSQSRPANTDLHQRRRFEPPPSA